MGDDRERSGDEPGGFFGLTAESTANQSGVAYSPPIPDIVLRVSSAVATGVIGNAAYDVLLSLRDRVARLGRSEGKKLSDDQVAILNMFVLDAMTGQALGHDLPFDRYDVRVVDWTTTKTRAKGTIRGAVDGHVEVDLKPDCPPEYRVKVTMRGSAH